MKKSELYLQCLTVAVQCNEIGRLVNYETIIKVAKEMFPEKSMNEAISSVLALDRDSLLSINFGNTGLNFSTFSNRPSAAKTIVLADKFYELALSKDIEQS